jgi:glycosidase
MANSLYPSLYQINTRVWLTELSEKLGRIATFDDIPDQELDKLAAMGFDWIWFLSVWQTGKEGQRISRQNAGWRKEFEETLSDLKEEDIAGSGFAITRYAVSRQIGGDAALERLHKRLQKRGMKLMLDFVPNHTGMDHDWVRNNPDFYINATEADLENEPANYTRICRDDGDLILAHGRDPFFPGWPDTVQLNYGNPLLQEAMINELLRISGQCDGVRCDMAMLVLPDVFERTWGIRCKPFWSEATSRVHVAHREFCFMAEVYWDLEWTMIQNGFDYAYDKRLYDRLLEGYSKPVREHLFAGIEYQAKMARFLENHDEPRAATAFSEGVHEAAAIITYLTPGLRFLHQGQLQGRKKRISPHLVRAPLEPVNVAVEQFYYRLLEILRKPLLRVGSWKLLECIPAWEDNWTNECYIAFAWTNGVEEIIVVTVNYSPNIGQCYIKIPIPDLRDKSWLLKDLLTGSIMEREGNDLIDNGLYLDEPPWSFYVLALNKKS